MEYNYIQTHWETFPLCIKLQERINVLETEITIVMHSNGIEAEKTIRL